MEAVLSMFGISGNIPSYMAKLQWDTRPLANFDCFDRELCSKIFLLSAFGNKVPLSLVLIEAERAEAETQKRQLIPRDLPPWFPVYVHEIARVLKDHRFQIIFELDEKHSIGEMFEVRTDKDGLVALLQGDIISTLTPVWNNTHSDIKYGCQLIPTSKYEKEPRRMVVSLGL